MSKIEEILQGYKNLLFKNIEVEEFALERLDICNTCPNRSNYPNELGNTSFCKQCGCILVAKVRSSKSSCPDKKWLEI